MLITLPDKAAVLYGGQSMGAMFMRGRRVWPDWLPMDMFADGKEGFWASLQGAMGQSRIFQDAAGTIPVTTYDQPVGRVVRGAGTVDLVQSVSGSRLTMARWPRGGRRNLLTWTEDLSDISWGVSDSTITLNADVAPDGSVAACRVVTDNGVFKLGTGLGKSADLNQGLVNGEAVISIYAKSDGARYLKIQRNQSAHDGAACFDLIEGEVVSIVATVVFTNLKATITDVGGGWFRCSYSSVTTDDFSARGFRFASSLDPLSGTNNRNSTGNGVDGVLLWHPQFELGDAENTSIFQKVTTANDVTEEGVESLWHLYNDGGDSLQTDDPVPAGTYGYAYVDPYGEITFDTRVSDGINPVTVADDPGHYLDLILRNGDFSAGEKVAITDYWERRYK